MLPTGLSCESLREILKNYGVLLRLNIEWIEHLFELDQHDAYKKLLTLGEHYLQSRPRERLAISDLKILLFPAMHLLGWKPLNPPSERSPDSSEERTSTSEETAVYHDPLPDGLKINLKKAVFSWIPKDLTPHKYFELHKSTAGLWQAENDHYTYQDLYRFMLALQLESQTSERFRARTYGQPSEDSQ